MKRLIFLLLLLTITFIPLSVKAVPSVDASDKIYDYAELFTPTEKDKLYNEIMDAIRETNLDIIVVTIAENDNYSATAYADDFFDYNAFGTNSSRDGILFLIDMDTRDLAISTSGQAIIMFDDYRIERMLDNIHNYATSSAWYNAAEIFVSDVKSYNEAGIPDSNKNYTVDKDGHLIVKKSINWIVAIIGAFATAGISLWVMLSKHKMIVPAKYANDYLDKNNIKMYAPQDRFLTTFTTSTTISSSSGGGSGRTGGSSVHRGSSGRSHGGGSRRF